jgi:peptidoglycan/LPS O-acetylase OafA/YrhL
MRTHHNERLQSLRGLAALCVLGGHTAQTFSTKTAIQHQVWFQPNAAVILFFVLSGYVLTLSLDRDRNLLRFAIRRLFRLLPVYWAGVLVGAGCWLLAFHPPLDDAATEFNVAISQSAQAVTWQNIWPNLVVKTVSMNGPLWSIQAELFVAPFIPLMVFVSRRVPLMVDFAVVSVLISLLRLRTPLLAEGLVFVAYLGCFYLGVTVAKLLQIQVLGKAFRLAPLAVGALFISGCISGHAPAFGVDFEGYLIASTFLSAWLVAYAASDASLSGVLALRPLIWLGNVSYSFYAYATAIMFVVAARLLPVLPMEWRTDNLGSAVIIWTVLLGTLSVSLPLASLSYRCLEALPNDAGRRIASLLTSPRKTFSRARLGGSARQAVLERMPVQPMHSRAGTAPAE